MNQEQLISALSIVALQYELTPGQKKAQEEGDESVLSVYFLGDGEFQIQEPENQWTTNYVAEDTIIRNLSDVICYMYKDEFMHLQERDEERTDAYDTHIFYKLHQLAGLLPESCRPWYYNEAEEYIKFLHDKVL